MHVHHGYYEKGLAPWEYPEQSLHCLCEKCHKKAQDPNTLLQRQIGKAGFGDDSQLIGYACTLESRADPTVPIDVFDYECALGVGDCYGLDAEEVIGVLEDGTIDGFRLR